METSAGPGSTFSNQCSSCDSSSPSSWCVDCNEALCSSCLLAHRRVTVTRSHQILDQPPAGAVKTPPTKFCKLHPSEPLKLFCFTCHQLTCRDCQLTLHMNHRYQFVSEALDKLKKQMEYLLQPIRTQSDTMRRSLRDMETRLQDIAESEARLQSELHHAHRVLIQHMMNRTTEILKKVKEVSEQESEQIRVRMRKLKQLQEQRQTLAESAEAATNTSNLSQLLHFASQVQALTRTVSDQDLSPPQNMVHLRVITDKPALEAILNFGKLQVESIPFSVTQPSPQNTYDPAVVPVKSLSSQSSASPSCSLPTSLPCAPSAGSSTVTGPAQTVGDVGSDRQLMSQTQPVNTFVVLQPFHQATNVLKVVMNQQTAPPQNQPADAPAVYQMPFGMNQLPFNVSYAQPGLARSSTRGATNRTAVNKQTRGRNQVLIVRTTETTAGPSHHVPQQQTSHQNPLLVHKQTAYIRTFVDNKQTHHQPLTVQNQIPDHRPYQDPNPPLNHKQTPLNQPPPARKLIPAMKMPEKQKKLRRLLIKDAEQRSGPQPVPENHKRPPDLQPSPENQPQVLTPTALSEQLLQDRPSPLHQQSQEAPPLPDGLPHQDQHSFLNHKQTPLHQPLPVRTLMQDTQIHNNNITLKWLLIQNHKQTSDPQPVPGNPQQTSDPQLVPGNPQQTSDPQLVPGNPQQTSDPQLVPGNPQQTSDPQPVPGNPQQTSDPQPVPGNPQQTSDPQPVPGNPQQTSDPQPVPGNPQQTSDPQLVPGNPQQTSDPQPVPGNPQQTSDPQPVPGNPQQTSDPQPVPGNPQETSDPQPVPGNHKQTPGNQSWQQQKQPPDLQPSPENQPQVLTTPTPLSEQLLQDRPSPFNARSQEAPSLLGIEPSPLHEQSQDEPSSSPVHSQSADQQALLAHQTSVALNQTADNEEAPEHQPLQDERPPYTPSLSHLSPASSVKAHPSSLVVKAVADSACDSSVQQVTLRHQEPAENEPTSTVSEEPEPSDSTPHAVDSDTEDPGSETRSQDFKLSLWQPTVSLDRLPLALSHPGSRLPSFRLVPGDAEDEFYLEELSEDSESHDADEHSKSGDEEVPDGYTEPLSSPDSPLTLQTVSCSVCDSANGSIICTACGRGYHRNCHLPPVGGDIWMDWTCTLCQDLTDPPHPYRPPRPQSPSLSLLDQRRCETLLLFLKVEGYALLSQMDWVWSRLTTMSERLTQQRPPKYETSAELLYDIWRLFKDASQDNASVNVLLENFESKVKETFSSDLTHPDQNLPRRSSHTKPAKTHTGPAVMSQEGSEVEQVLNDKCELKNTRKRPGDCSDLNEARKRKMKSDL